MPERQFGSTMPKKRCEKLAPEAACALLQRLQVDRRQHGEHAAHHEGQREQHVADQDENPASAQVAPAAERDDQRQRGRETGNRHGHHQQFLDRPRERVRLARQHVRGGHAEHQRAGETGDRDLDRQQDGVPVVVPDLQHPVERQAGPPAFEVVLRHSGHHRHRHRHHQEGADEEREGQQQPEDRGAALRHQPAAATVLPAAVRATARTAQVIAPSTNDNAAAIATLAASVNSV